MTGRLFLAALVILVVALPGVLEAQQSADQVRRMTLQELLDVEITTVERSPEGTIATPAAVTVLTQEDIHRSGASTLPELLRLAPEVQVGRIDAGKWAVGVRGFPDRLARSMLVLIDGRAVYSPLFAGTYWEVQDTLLEDVERIEIVRGPGGTLWGANAVNGVINIITRPARETQGALAGATLGSEQRGQGFFRYGAPIGGAGHLRAYVKSFAWDAQHHDAGADYDDWWKAQAGFRSDWTLPAARTLTVQGDVYAVRLGQRQSTTTYTPPFANITERHSPLSGANVLARWSGDVKGLPGAQLQAYWDHTRRDERPAAETRDTLDLDFQQRPRSWGRHELVWGVGYRLSAGRIMAVAPTGFLPPDRTDNLFSAFVHDEFPLVPDRVRLTVGTKVEHNAYSGVEVQPSTRAVWSPNTVHTLAGSVTRAVRTPSRVETDYTTTSLVNPAIPSFVRLLPNPDFESEELIAYEAIYRVRPAPSLFLAVTSFFNQLDNVLSTELDTAFVEPPLTPARLILPVDFRNGLHGNSRGVSISTDVRPANWLRTTGNYSFEDIELTRYPDSRDVSQERRNEGLTPRHQIQLRASVDLPRAVSLDWFWRYVSELPAGPVPAYNTSNMRVAWRVASGVEISVVGENLHEARHAEWPGSGSGFTGIQRSISAGFTWRLTD